MEQEEMEEKFDINLQELMPEEKTRRDVITIVEIRKAIKEIKNKKAEDKNSWKAEQIKKKMKWC